MLYVNYLIKDFASGAVMSRTHLYTKEILWNFSMGWNIYDPILENCLISATVFQVTSATIQHDLIKAMSTVIKRRNEKKFRLLNLF